MEELKERYQDIILAWTPSYSEDMESIIYSIHIRFKDNSRLEVREKFIKEIDHRRYSYQYMEADNALIICWDNAPHHPEISTHPYHKHIKTRQNIQASEEMNLPDVLAFIAKTLLVLAFLVTIRQIFVS